MAERLFRLALRRGDVEKFYISCGYTPTEYKVWENGAPCLKRVFVGLEDYASYDRQGDGFVVMRKEI